MIHLRDMRSGKCGSLLHLFECLNTIKVVESPRLSYYHCWPIDVVIEVNVLKVRQVQTALIPERTGFGELKNVPVFICTSVCA